MEKKLGDILVGENFITEDQLNISLEEQKHSNIKLGEILIKKEYITPEQLVECLSYQGYERIAVDKLVLDKNFLDMAGVKKIVDNTILPIRVIDDILWVVTDDPINYKNLEEFVAIYEALSVHTFVDTQENIRNKIKEIYPGIFFEESGADKGETEDEDEYINIDETVDLYSEKSPIVSIVDEIIVNGIAMGASDIHMEPQTKEDSIVRYRVDGALYEHYRIPQKWKHHVVARCKVLSNMDISKHLEPQDGEITFKYMSANYNIRVNILPLVNGEKVVMRILDQASALLKVEELELGPEEEILAREKLSRKQGMIIVTGPTGSGKTTTLYSMLAHVKSSEVNITTIENPVEIALPGVNQTQVTKKTTFSDALKAILRQDPDIIMVGEIRDFETADIAIKSALTGHLVFTTIHTNSAVGVVTRLMNMGVEPYLVADALELVISQRLVRRLCQHCKVEDREGLVQMKELYPEKFQDCDVIYKAKGCTKCKNLGYSGRIAVYEMFAPDEQLRISMVKGELEKIQSYKNFKSMFDDAMRKVKEGKISLKQAWDKAK
ncbi:MAG TPA: hypothetical protein DEP72_02135 [Clostridiales bacterium]|nr:MAG: hypothetical protein A2Y18_00325 [Clostridiales bacterium GWD2_32_19]HCC06955.1 hypothetical protein [Clostridiales bacterium]